MHHLGCGPFFDLIKCDICNHDLSLSAAGHEKDNIHIHNSNPSHSRSIRSEIVLAWPRICPTCPASASKATSRCFAVHQTLHSNLRQGPHMITCCPVLCNPVSPSPSYHHCNPLRSPVLKKEKALASPPSQRQQDGRPAVICNFWLPISNFQSQTTFPFWLPPGQLSVFHKPQTKS